MKLCGTLSLAWIPREEIIPNPLPKSAPNDPLILCRSVPSPSHRIGNRENSKAVLTEDVICYQCSPDSEAKAQKEVAIFNIHTSNIREMVL